MGPLDMHGAGLQADFQLAEGQQVVVQHLHRAAAQQGAQAGPQLVGLEGFGRGSRRRPSPAPRPGWRRDPGPRAPGSARWSLRRGCAPSPRPRRRRAACGPARSRHDRRSRPRSAPASVSRISAAQPSAVTIGRDGGGGFGVVLDDQDAGRSCPDPVFGRMSEHHHVGVKHIRAAHRPQTAAGAPRGRAGHAGCCRRGAGPATAPGRSGSGRAGRRGRLRRRSPRGCGRPWRAPAKRAGRVVGTGRPRRPLRPDGTPSAARL